MPPVMRAASAAHRPRHMQTRVCDRSLSQSKEVYLVRAVEDVEPERPARPASESLRRPSGPGFKIAGPCRRNLES